MTIKKKSISDQCGSVSQMRAVVREVLWGMVANIHMTNDELPSVDGIFGELEADLPMQFGSKNKKRKRGRGEAKPCGKKLHNGLSSTFPVPKYNGTLLEENVYKIAAVHEKSDVLVRIMGIGPANPIGSSVMVRYLGKCGSTECEDANVLVELPRKSLEAIPASERIEAHKLVQLDEQRILMSGIPDDVHLKYWDQRYRMLTLFDRGVRLDAESWYSITPELVAKHVTAACIGRARGLHCPMNKVLDCFSGCGGNTIPFAVQGRTVVSVDLDPVKLGHLRHNCGVYGVDAARVSTVCADVYELLASLIPAEKLTALREKYDELMLKAADSTYVTDDTETTEDSDVPAAVVAVDGETAVKSNAGDLQQAPDEAPIEVTPSEAIVSTPTVEEAALPPSTDSDRAALCASPDLIILSPPWGGPAYLNAKEYCLYTMLTSGCGLLLAMLAAAVAPNLLFLLPVNTSREQVEFIADVIEMPFVIEYVSLNNAPKVMAIYMGNFVAKQQALVINKAATSTNNHVVFD